MLTDEEKQILKERELLENLELLLSFETVRYLHFLVEPQVDDSNVKAASTAKGGDNAKKKKK